jgi:hypothetical protein
LPDCYSIIAAALLFKKIVKSSKDRRRKMLFHQTWSQSSEDRSENPKLGWSKFSASFIRLLLVALCGTIVYGSSSARESTEGSFIVTGAAASPNTTFPPRTANQRVLLSDQTAHSGMVQHMVQISGELQRMAYSPSIPSPLPTMHRVQISGELQRMAYSPSIPSPLPTMATSAFLQQAPMERSGSPMIGRT